MKKRLLFLMFSACILCAVSLKFLSNEEERQRLFSDAEVTSIREIDLVEEASQDADDFSEQIKDLEKETTVGNVAGEAEHTESANEEYVAGQAVPEFAYAYHCLNEKEKDVYEEIYHILITFGEDKPLSITEAERIGEIFQCVLNDHPEIFYVQGYTYTTYTRGDEVVRLTLSGTYTMTPEEAAMCREGIDAYVSECLAGLSAEASDYEKVKYVYEYLIDHTEYQQDSLENQNICSVFLNGKSVCQGYAKATQYLLNEAGVFSTLVIGSVSQGEGHAWNLVQMDGNYYYVDTTWGDASYQLEEKTDDAWEQSSPDINYDYLGVTTEQLKRTHNLNNVVPLPFCVSMDCNYYVKEGTYLTSGDEETLKQLFETKFVQNKGYITLKCMDDTVYHAVRKILIEEQKIFAYLHQTDGTVAYSDNQEQLSLSFWL